LSDSTSSVLPVIYVGTPSEKQKLLVWLYNEDMGAIQNSVVKIPLTAMALDGLENEYNVLHELHKNKSFSLPSVSKDNGRYMATTLWNATQGSPRLSFEYAKILSDLVTGQTLSVKTLVCDLNAKVKRQSACNQNDVIFCLLNNLFKTQQYLDLPEVVCHGDFAPWNVLFKGSEIYMIDWEDAALSGPPLYDMTHFMISISLLLGHRMPTVSEFLRMGPVRDYRSKLCLGEEESRFLVLYYLADKMLECKVCRKMEWVSFIQKYFDENYDDAV